MKKVKETTVFLIFVLSFTTLSAQRISEIEPQLKGNVIEITYKIKGAKFNQHFEVKLFVSNDGGQTYQGPMTLAEGKKNEVTEGKHTLVWEVFKDMNTLDKELLFDIRAEVIDAAVKKQFFIQYAAGALPSSIDYITPFGVRAGMLGKTGFYIAGYWNTFEEAPFSYEEENIAEEIFYEFTSESIFPRMAFTAGAMFQLGWKSHFYAGAGFATKKYYRQLNELNLDGSVKSSEQWVNIASYEQMGVEVEAGFMFNFKHMNFSFGASSFNFEHLGAQVAVGVTF